jgi:hypothetical protein
MIAKTVTRKNPLLARDSEFLGLASAPSLSRAGRAKIYYDTVADEMMVSTNGGAYSGLGGGAGSDTTAFHQSGDAFGATAVMGTTDAQDVQFTRNIGGTETTMKLISGALDVPTTTNNLVATLRAPGLNSGIGIRNIGRVNIIQAGASVASFEAAAITFRVNINVPSNNLDISLAGSEGAPNLGLKGGAGTAGFFNPAGNVVALTTNSLERWRVGSDGKVGINEKAASVRFHVTESTAGDDVALLEGESVSGGAVVGLRVLNTNVTAGDGISLNLQSYDDASAVQNSARLLASLPDNSNGNHNGKFILEVPRLASLKQNFIVDNDNDLIDLAPGSGTGVLRISPGAIKVTDGYIEGNELGADAAAPGANGFRIYAVDNGGKTELKAIFATGVAQQLAIEP